MEHGKEVFRHGRILRVEETGTFQNALSSFGGRMIQKFHFSGRQFTALLGLDHESGNGSTFIIPEGPINLWIRKHLGKFYQKEENQN